MKRVRWALLLLIAFAAVGVASSTVFAGSSKKAVTYWNHAIAPTSYPGASSWLGYNQTAVWSFSVAELQWAMPGSVTLNFAGLSRSTQVGGGSGYSTTMRVAVTGTGSGTFTTTLANPWKPHVAYSASPGVGWQAYGTLTLPNYVWTGASLLTVRVTAITSNTLMSIGGSQGLLIGYATAG